MEISKNKLEIIKNALQYAVLYAKTEKEEAETHGNTEVEHLADNREIERRKKPS